MTDATHNLDSARRYITALSTGADADAVGAFFAPDVVQEEFPNRLLPSGATRDLAQMKEGRERGRKLLSAERFEILSAIASGDTVAMELRWSGTIAAAAGLFSAGQELRARFAMFVEFREGRIVRQRNYDCFEPW